MNKLNKKQSFLKDLYQASICLFITDHFNIRWLVNTNYLMVKNLTSDQFYKVDLYKVFNEGNFYLGYFDVNPVEGVLVINDFKTAEDLTWDLMGMNFFQKENKTLKPDYYPNINYN